MAPAPDEANAAAPSHCGTQLPRRVEKMIVFLCWRKADSVSDQRELAHDLRQQALALLWKIDKRVKGMPSPEAEAFTYRCVRRIVTQTLAQEVYLCKPLVRGEAAAQAIAITITETATDDEAESLLPLDQQIQHPQIAAAFAALSPQEREVLDLACRLQFTDRRDCRAAGSASRND